METNKTEDITKKIAIQRTLKIISVTIVFVLLGSYLMYGKIPTTTLIVLLVFIPIFMIIPAILGFKYRHKINNSKSKFMYFYMTIGALMALINLIIIFGKEVKTTNYINVIIGIAIVIYSIKIKNRQKKL